MEQLEFNFEQPVATISKSIYEEKSEFFSKLISFVKNIQLLEESGSLSFEKTVLKYNLYKLLDENLKDVLFSLEWGKDFDNCNTTTSDYLFLSDFDFKNILLSIIYRHISVRVPFKFKNTTFINSERKIVKESFSDIFFGLDENFEDIYEDLITFDTKYLQSKICDDIGQKLFDKLYSDNVDAKVLFALVGGSKTDEDIEKYEAKEKLKELNEKLRYIKEGNVILAELERKSKDATKAIQEGSLRTQFRRPIVLGELTDASISKGIVEDFSNSNLKDKVNQKLSSLHQVGLDQIIDIYDVPMSFFDNLPKEDKDYFEQIKNLQKTDNGLGVAIPTDSRIDALEKSIEDIKRMISDIVKK